MKQRNKRAAARRLKSTSHGGATAPLPSGSKPKIGYLEKAKGRRAKVVQPDVLRKAAARKKKVTARTAI